MAKKNAMASKVEYAVKELQTKLDVKRTTEELKAKLMAKSKYMLNFESKTDIRILERSKFGPFL